ncbi:MAG TPA: V-type ATP synthase subunit E [Nitrospirota bacterium]|nr:V-type ATP synthase subunit E [Nitrospirota bacterium]
MGCKELIESLRKIRDEKIVAIWNEVEAEAAVIKDEVSRKREQLRSDLELKEAAAASEKNEQALSEAHRSSRSHRLTAEKEITDRLFALAARSLGQARTGEYPAVFRELVRELPSFIWKQIQVNHADASLAREYFPAAEIVPADGITGGLIATVEGERIRVDNSFEKRLERCWPELVPEMIKEIYEHHVQR